MSCPCHREPACMLRGWPCPGSEHPGGLLSRLLTPGSGPAGTSGGRARPAGIRVEFLFPHLSSRSRRRKGPAEWDSQTPPPRGEGSRRTERAWWRLRPDDSLRLPHTVLFQLGMVVLIAVVFPGSRSEAAGSVVSSIPLSLCAASCGGSDAVSEKSLGESLTQQVASSGSGLWLGRGGRASRAASPGLASNPGVPGFPLGEEVRVLLSAGFLRAVVSRTFLRRLLASLCSEGL